MRQFILLFFASLLIHSVASPQEPTDPFTAAIENAKSNMMVDPPAALAAAELAESLVSSDMHSLDIATAMWLQGEALTRMNRPQDAAAILDAAINTIESTKQGSKLHADLQRARANTAGMMSDYATALTNFQSAHDIYLKTGDMRSQAMALLNIANIHADARNYTKAITYYDMAGEVYSDDPQIDLSRLNNLATAHRELEQFQFAEQNFSKALAIAEEIDSAFLQSRILTNLAAVQLDQNKLDQASDALALGLALEKSQSSGWEPFLVGMQSKVAFARGDVARSKVLMDEVFSGISLANSPSPFLEFHESAVEIYRAASETELALKHLQAFKRLDDEKRDISAAANTALLGAEFDFATQELQISKLRTETLEQEIALTASRARQRALILFTGGIVLVILFAGGMMHYLSMRQSRNEIRKTNTKLSESNSALEVALKAKSEFLATTSHEIRTPLNAILGMSQLLVEQDNLGADIRERAELVHSSSITMKAIVDDILDMSKLESGNVTVELEDCALRDTLDSIVRTWTDRAAEKQLRIETNFDDCPQYATTDERKLRQIVFNLISNAVKFTDSGMISVQAELDEASPEPNLVLTVSDTGCGIPTDQLNCIFEPFYQVDSSNTRQHSGTGLGLAISQNLAQALGGSVSVESEIEKGSSFTFKLPLQFVEGLREDITANMPQVGTLIIEPNILRQGIFEGLLCDRLEHVKIVETISEAFEALERFPPKAVYVSFKALGDEVSDAVATLMTLSDKAGASKLVTLLEEASQIDPAILRLSGIDVVIEGVFDAAAILDNLDCSSETPANQSIELIAQSEPVFDPTLRERA